jgi:hypothetical protein
MLLAATENLGRGKHNNPHAASHVRTFPFGQENKAAYHHQWSDHSM